MFNVFVLLWKEVCLIRREQGKAWVQTEGIDFTENSCTINDMLMDWPIPIIHQLVQPAPVSFAFIAKIFNVRVLIRDAMESARGNSACLVLGINDCNETMTGGRCVH